MRLVKIGMGYLVLAAPLAKAAVYAAFDRPIDQQFALSGSYPESVAVNAPHGRTEFRVEIANGAINYTDLDYLVPTFTRAYSGAFTDPITFTQKTIQTTIAFDTMQFVGSSGGPQLLTALVGGGFNYPSPVGFGDVTVSGNFTVSGPTESIVGTFTRPITQRPIWFGFSLGDPGLISSDISSTAFTTGTFRVNLVGPAINLLSVTVDGIPISMSLSDADAYGFNMTFGIPEPSVVGLSVFAGLIAVRKRSRGTR